MDITTCSECNRGIKQGQFCETCKGTGFIEPVIEPVEVKEEKVVEEKVVEKKKK